MTATAVSATLTCTNTSATGTMSATASGTEYSGMATLLGLTVPVRILKGAVPCG